MGSLADIHNFGDKRRFRAWVLAAATALVGAQLLHAGGIVDLGKSMYHAGSGLNWVGHIVGGLMLGFGMVFAGGCPSRNLVRAGSGDLRALLTIVVLGLFAYIAIGGLFGPVRAWLEQATSIPLKSPDPRPWRPARVSDRIGRRDRRPGAHDDPCRRGPRLLLRRSEVPRLARARLFGACDRRDHRGRLGAHRARLRRDGRQARGPDLAHLRAAGGRRAAMAARSTPPRPCRASAPPAYSAR